jgi:predicted amidohydrolase
LNPHPTKQPVSTQQVRIGIAQILVEGARPQRNLNRAVAAISQAADQGCRLIVLPECLDLGWTDPSARELAQPIPGPNLSCLAEAARKSRTFVAAGLVERAGERLFNAAVIIGPEGDLLLHHRKINELDIALDLYSVGDRLGVVDTELGRLALSICADNFSSSLAIAHVLCRMGAQVILSPSAWAVDADYDDNVQPYGQLWRDAYGELTRLYPVTVIGVSNVGLIRGGPWKGRRCIGCSLAMGPDAEILAHGPYGEQAEAIISVEVTVQPPMATGTGVAESLKAKGYAGP